MVTFGNAILRPGAGLASRRASLKPTNSEFVALQQLVTKATFWPFLIFLLSGDGARYFFSSSSWPPRIGRQAFSAAAGGPALPDAQRRPLQREKELHEAQRRENDRGVSHTP